MGRGVRFSLHERWRRDRLSVAKAAAESHGEFVYQGAVWSSVERYDECLQGVSQDGNRGLLAAAFCALQSDGGTAAEDDDPRVQLDNDPDNLAQPQNGSGEAEDPGDGKPLLVHLPLPLAGEAPEPRGLQEGRRVSATKQAVVAEPARARSS